MSARWSGAVRLTAWAWLAALCACLTLGPLVDSKTFLFVGGFAGALVAVAGAIGRLAHLPAPVIVLAQLVVLLEWATLGYASEQAWAGVVPTAESFRVLADLVAAAVDTANANAPPAPADTAVTACLAVIVALVVLLVDVVAVTWRRPALVGLPFLGVYMAPVSLWGTVPVLAFVPAALGYIFLLAAEQRDRLSHWGRKIAQTGTLLAGPARLSAPVTSLVSAGRRVGFGAVALAVVLPVLVPTLPQTFLADGPLTADGDTGGEGSGDGPVDLDDPMLDLRKNLDEQSEAVLVTFTTNDPFPGYLRLAALDRFTGSSWEASDRDEDTSADLSDVPAIPGLDPGLGIERAPVSYDVQVTEEFRSTWLPVVYPITQVRAEGSWGIDPVQLDISARDDSTTQGLGYSFSGQQPVPTREQLARTRPPPAALDPFVELPSDLPPEIARVALDVTEGDDTAIAQALSLQDWFRIDGGFEYSLRREGGSGIGTIRDFITDNRAGYCEQFAASMALMARTLGIPSRVAVGFLRPEPTGTGTFACAGVDMHAWPELYFEGAGWLKFEPTPAIRTGEAPTYQPDDGSATDPTRGPDLPSTEAVDPLRPSLDPGAAAGASSDGNDGLSRVLIASLAGALFLAALAVAPRLVREALRRRRWTRTAAGEMEPAWRELHDGTVDLGLRFDDTATLRGAGRALRPWLDADAPAVDALNRLVLRVERSRFARGPVGPVTVGTAADPRADVETVLDHLAANRSRGRLLRATWLPMSLLPSSWRDDRRSRSHHAYVSARDGAVVHVEGTATQ